MKDLFGGSSSSNSSQQSSASGFGALPPDIQHQINELAKSAGNTLNPNGTPNASLFTLPSLSTPSSNALSQVQNQDFAITPQSIKNNVAEQLDPYQTSVINQIERAQNGNESALNSYLTNSGTFGSNRGMLGASDISNAAADQVGSFLSGEFNTALNNALTTIPQNEAQSASGSVGAGQLQQSQTMQNQQAPISALAALAQILNTGVPATSTGQGTSSGSSSSVNGGGIMGNLGNIGTAIGGIGALAGLFSDMRLKENIQFTGYENGIPVYNFNYKGLPQRYNGVMAQDILKSHPEAIGERDGYLTVDYSKICVKFKRLGN